MTDKEEIIRALSLWFKPGDVFEIRALGATSSCNRQEHTVSGYFDFEHIRDAAEAVCKLYGFRGVYATTNPVKPDLLARAVNRIRPLGRNDPTTADGDVIRRRWLLIDCDADRPAGISSTDAEHEAALAKIREIRDGLASLGWPQPVMTDSGNGAQLMYAIDLPANDCGLVQKCLESLAAASDEHVHVDKTVSNPARIWRLPGTMNCKGDHAEGFRPHRMARIIEAPTDLITVTEEQLRTITVETAECPPCPNQPANDSTAFYNENGGFNLDAWISEHCPDIQDAQPYKDGRKWIFPVCPFDANHSNKSAALFQNAAGAIGFRCLHNGCLGNDWRKLRVMLEPGCYDHREEHFPGVDISGILGQKCVDAAADDNGLIIHQAETIVRPVIIIPEEPEIILPWRTVTNADVLKAISGTLLEEMCNQFAMVSNPPLPLEAVLPKALVLCGAALSQQMAVGATKPGDGNMAGCIGCGPKLAKLKINTGGGQVCNFFSILAAPSSSGKDIGGFLELLAIKNNWFIGSAGSGEGLAEAYMTCPNGLLCISELQPWLDAKHWQHRATEFLTFSFNKGFFRQTFSSRGGKASIRAADYCYPNIIAYVQPGVFAKVVATIDLENGFLGRFLFTKMPEFFCEANVFDPDKPLEIMANCLDVFKRKQGVVNVPLGYSHGFRDIFQKHAAPELGTCWKRLASEYYPRLAVVLSVKHSIKTQGEAVILTDECFANAAVLVNWFFAHAEKLILSVTDAEPRAKERENIIRKVFLKIRKLDRGSGVTITQVSQSGIRNSSSKERRDALLELIDRGHITGENGRYAIINTPPEWEE